MSIWFDLIVHFFSIMNAMAYCSGVMNRKRSNFISSFLYVFWALIIVLDSIAFRYIAPIRLVTVTALMFAAACHLFRGRYGEKLRVALECLLMSFVGELFGMAMHGYLLSQGYDITVYDSMGRAVMTLVATAIVAGIVPVLILIRKRAMLSEVWRVVVCQFALCATQIAMILLAFLSAKDVNEEFVTCLALIQIPGILLSLFCTRTILYLSDMVIDKREKEFESQKQVMEYDYYKLAMESNEKLSFLRHDMSNTLQTVLALIRNGDVEKGNEILSELEVAYKSTKPVVLCDNEIVNIILSIKNDDMGKNGIIMNVAVNCELKSMPPTDRELTSVLSNLLDNAKEACLKCDGNGVVSLSFGHKQGYYIIKMTNSCNPSEVSIPDNPGIAVSTKDDKQHHGFGLRSINEISEKYNGSFSMYLDGDKVVSIVTFAENTKAEETGDCIIV